MSPIPLGFWATAGAGGGAAAGAYELISTANGDGSSGTITFSSIPSTYKHLQIRYVGGRTAGATDLNIRANSVTSGYSSHYLQNDGSTVVSGAYSGSNRIIFQNAMGSSATNGHSAGVIDILDYASSNKNKTFRGLTGLLLFSLIDMHSGMLPSTSAISTIDLYVSTGSLSTTSRFSLYGIVG